MVSAIGGSGILPFANRALPAPSLSDEQKQFVTDTLSAFDPESLSADDAKQISARFREQGIAPGRGLAEVMAASGFDAREVGKLAGVEAPPAGQVAPTASTSSDIISYLSQLLADQGNEPLSEESKQTILQALRDKFGLDSGAVIDERA